MRQSDSFPVRANARCAVFKDYSIAHPHRLCHSAAKGENIRLYEKLSQWRARRVLLIGGPDEGAQLLCALLTALGARPVCLPPQAGSEALYRALTDGRVSAIIVSSPRLLRQTPGAYGALLTEAHQTGVPLTLLCPEGDVQEAALRALMFGAQFFEDGELPCGVYDLTNMP